MSFVWKAASIFGAIKGWLFAIAAVGLGVEFLKALILAIVSGVIGAVGTIMGAWIATHRKTQEIAVHKAEVQNGPS